MFHKLQPASEKLIRRTTGIAQKYAVLVILAALFSSGIAAMFVVQNVAINTDTEEMLSEKLAWRQTYQVFKQEFPYFADLITVVVDGETPDLARDAAASLSAALKENSDSFEEVFDPANHPILKQNQFLYLSTTQLYLFVEISPPDNNFLSS